MTWIGRHREGQEHEVVQHLAEVLVHDSVHECGQAQEGHEQQHAVQEEGVVEEREVDAEIVEVEIPVGVELVGEDVELDLQRFQLQLLRAPRGGRIGQRKEERRDEERQEELQEEVEELVVEVVLVRVGDVEEVRGVAQAPPRASRVCSTLHRRREQPAHLQGRRWQPAQLQGRRRSRRYPPHQRCRQTPRTRSPRRHRQHPQQSPAVPILGQRAGQP